MRKINIKLTYITFHKYIKKDTSKGSLLLGGYSDLKFIFDLLNSEDDKNYTK